MRGVQPGLWPAVPCPSVVQHRNSGSVGDSHSSSFRIRVHSRPSVVETRRLSFSVSPFVWLRVHSWFDSLSIRVAMPKDCARRVKARKHPSPHFSTLAAQRERATEQSAGLGFPLRLRARVKANGQQFLQREARSKQAVGNVHPLSLHQMRGEGRGEGSSPWVVPCSSVSTCGHASVFIPVHPWFNTGIQAQSGTRIARPSESVCIRGSSRDGGGWL